VPALFIVGTRSKMVAKRTSLMLIAWMSLGVWLGYAGELQPPRYFPETGRAAIHQRALDLGGSVVVMAVALQPGYEDLPTLTNLRMGLGAKLITVYVTNGDATPSDLSGEAPFLLAARRKEEAYQVTRALDGEPYFLNTRDLGVVRDRSELERSWVPDTVVSRLKVALLSYRPDVVLVQRDFRTRDTSETIRERFLIELVLRAVESARVSTGKQGSPGIAPWRVERVFVESVRGGENAVRVRIDAAHPIWKKSFRDIGREIMQQYRSLKARATVWEESRSHTYTSVLPKSTRHLGTLTIGLPVLSKRFQAIREGLVGVQKSTGGSLRSSSLDSVAAAISSLDRLLYRESSSMTAAEKRIAAHWKDDLEALRCALLGVKFTYECDSLTTERQLIYLRFKDFKTKTSKANTEIFFPGAMKHEWGINESVNYRFKFEVPQEFRIITPERMEYNAPMSVYGLRRSHVRTRFSFIIYHHDSTRTHEFICRGEMWLGVGPKRTFEILNPLVRAEDGEPLAYSFFNFSRNGFEGQVSLVDSLFKPASREVRILPVKDYFLEDTIRLFPKRQIPPGNHAAELTVSGRGETRHFIARSFEVHADTTKRVCLLTGITHSPVAEALRRLHIPFAESDSAALASGDLSSVSVIVVDQDAMLQRKDVVDALARLRPWVEGGGHMVVLQQSYAMTRGSDIGWGVAFRLGPALEPQSPLTFDSLHGFLRRPNLLQLHDWQGWVVARAMGSLEVGNPQPAQIPVRAQTSGDPLIVTIPEQKGRITYVALDVYSQLVNIHPGTFRLLANLLAYPYIHE
jgi:LmbE family N-acetylglucosaminyl deacetylase